KKDTMKRKILISGIIVVFVAFVAVGIFGCQRKSIPVLIKEESNSIQTEKEISAETPKEIEMEELSKDYSLFISEITQADSFVNGIVKEISGRNLTIVEFTEKGKETSSLVVPVSQEAEIIANHILDIFPRGASQEKIDEYLRSQIPEKKEGEEIEKYNIEIPEGMSEEESKEYVEEYIKRQTSEKETGEQITGMMTGPKGGTWYFLGNGISFEEIRIGDVVFIVLESKSDNVEGISVEVWPVDFLINRVNFN
ncbi:MAG: hypothetical protein Q8N87_00340, partial [bacterium]|nr:hypothetical protein [bacterium]